MGEENEPGQKPVSIVAVNMSNRTVHAEVVVLFVDVVRVDTHNSLAVVDVPAFDCCKHLEGLFCAR